MIEKLPTNFTENKQTPSSLIFDPYADPFRNNSLDLPFRFTIPKKKKKNNTNNIDSSIERENLFRNRLTDFQYLQ